MDEHLLDNPGWHALNGPHSHLALRGAISARYPADIIMGGALADYNAAGMQDLRRLVAAGEVIGLFGLAPPDPPGWRLLNQTDANQMIGTELQPQAVLDATALTAADVPEMLALVEIAQPGPFLRQTIKLGGYRGVRRDGRLVAMAGQRLHLPGYCEISAVCTHPDYRGRGYGGALTCLVAAAIRARGETPFLHVALANQPAVRLYTRLGFTLRRQVPISILLAV